MVRWRRRWVTLDDAPFHNVSHMGLTDFRNAFWQEDFRLGAGCDDDDSTWDLLVLGEVQGQHLALRFWSKTLSSVDETQIVRIPRK